MKNSDEPAILAYGRDGTPIYQGSRVEVICEQDGLERPFPDWAFCCPGQKGIATRRDVELGVLIVHFGAGSHAHFSASCLRVA